MSKKKSEKVRLVSHDKWEHYLGFIGAVLDAGHMDGDFQLSSQGPEAHFPAALLEEPEVARLARIYGMKIT